MKHWSLHNDLWNEFDQLQQQVASLFGGFPSSIRSYSDGTFPPLNVGMTDDTVEIVAFVPGMKPDQIDVSIDQGLLTIRGERPTSFGQQDNDEARRYAQERFSGAFRRVIELPDNANPEEVTARCANGCLTVSIAKRQSSRPRAITVQ
ncbi:MAG TPA: Hsp20/alpha crystallin family protein [Burkholderiaceae bacterium]|nr:Hsp20/alpha crystallin family protein [Burkholderiaceae bacterium]